MKRPRRVWRTLGERRRIGPCRTCGLSLGLHNRAQRLFCGEQMMPAGQFTLIDAVTFEAVVIDVKREQQRAARRRFL